MRFPFPRTQGGVPFAHPLDPAPKTIVLSPGFLSTRMIRVFPDGWNPDAVRLCPCALAAPMVELHKLARTGIELRHAVIVLTRSSDVGLVEEDRDLLWRAFGVPVFEQCLGQNNEVLAAECEAHDGLHVVGGLAGAPLETATCGCGSSVPRKMPASQPGQRERIFALVS